jgi:hypothetical protein
MLPEPLRILISAYAVGDLTPRRREAAERLLRHSGEARYLLRELKRNRRRLRRMPKPELPPDFTARVLSALPDQPPIIRPGLLTQPQGQWTVTGRFAVAAVILLGIGLSAALVNSFPRDAESASTADARRPVPAADDLARAPEPGPKPDEDAPPIVAPEPEVAVVKEVPPETPATRPSSSPKKAPAPLGNVTLVTPSILQVKPPRLPLAVSVRGIDQVVRPRLQRAFDKSEAHHVDLFCRDTTRAFDRLENAIKARGARLYVDAMARETHKHKLRSQYVFFTDDLTASDWARLLQQVGLADKRAEEVKAGDGVFDHVVVLPFDAGDQKELTAVFGSDLSQSDSRPKRPADGKKDGKLAVAGVVSPVRTPPSSKEVRQYLDGRRDRPDNAIAVLLVLRLVGM